MTLAAKGRRLLHVHGADYFWKVSRDAEGLELRATVQLASGAGGKLLVSARAGLDDTLTPALIARAIECALACGWAPLTAGPTFRVTSRRGYVTPAGR